MNNFFPTLNSVNVQHIISLAKQRAVVSYGKYPDGFELGKTQPAPISPEETTLKNAIDALPTDVAQDLSALMYLGRDGLENQSVAEAVEWLRNDASKREDKWVKQTLYSKTPLGDYLEQGLQIIQGA
jgi:hypothetical protein